MVLTKVVDEHSKLMNKVILKSMKKIIEDKEKVIKKEIAMKHKVGDKVRIFGTDKKVKIIGIEEGVQADIYGTMISAYKIQGTYKLYVDIFDGTVSAI